MEISVSVVSDASSSMPLGLFHVDACFGHVVAGSRVPVPERGALPGGSSVPACLGSPAWFPASSSWFLGSVLRPVRPGLGVTAGRATGRRCVPSLSCAHRGGPFPFLVAGAARGTLWTSPLPGRSLDPGGLYLSHLELGIGIPELSGDPYGNNDEMERNCTSQYRGKRHPNGRYGSSPYLVAVDDI